MDLLVIALIVLVILSFSGWGYGRYYAMPVGGRPGPWVDPLGILGLVLFIALLVLLFSGWHVWTPWAPTVPPP